MSHTCRLYFICSKDSVLVPVLVSESLCVIKLQFYRHLYDEYSQCPSELRRIETSKNGFKCPKYARGVQSVNGNAKSYQKVYD